MRMYVLYVGIELIYCYSSNLASLIMSVYMHIVAVVNGHFMECLDLLVAAMLNY
jgi:hypothetical protein